MKSDLSRLNAAKVDLNKVKYTKPESLGIDFTNEIDVWSKMEFRYRSQIKNFGKNRTIADHHILKGLGTLVYSFREKID